jgi:hypothetical protein
MRKVRLQAAKSPDAKQNKALSLAEELVMTSPDVEVTVDEAAILSSAGPPRGKFFRLHRTVRGDVRILKLKVGVKQERYLVTKSAASKLDYVSAYTAFLGVTLDGTPFLWLIAVSDDTWSASARRIAVDAMERWVRLVSNNASGTYHKRVLKAEQRDPDFKGLDEKTFVELLQMAFDAEHIISDVNHPVAQQVLNGE